LDGDNNYEINVSATDGTFRDFQAITVRVTTGSEPSGGSGVQGSGVQTWAVENSATSHQWTRSEAVEHATVFDLITALPIAYRNHVAAMKNANPDLVLVGYMNAMFAQRNEGTAYPEWWYARDADGNKVRSRLFGNYLMKPNIPGWVSNRIENCRKVLADGYDGCTLDMLGTAPLLSGYVTGLPINPATGKVWTKSEWLAATSNLARQIAQAVEPAAVYGNGLGYGTRYFDHGADLLLEGLDGGVAEIFIRTANDSVNAYRSESRWKQDVDMLVDAGNRGSSVLTITKLWSDATAAQQAQWHEYAYASFLLGTNGNSFFTFSFSKDEDPMAGHPWWSIDLGQPAGSYTTTNGIYWRDWTNGKVAVNPTDQSRTINVGGTYRRLNGTQVSGSITLPPHTGRVLIQP
jgi:hypothetical protein